jgi:3-isopropylmalate/(R)-2-methylmalate dehydratase small subunit
MAETENRNNQASPRGTRLEGNAWKFGDDIDTDVIIPARYLVTSDAAELGKHCMEDADPAFVSKISEGDIIVGGENFGCGSSREHAPLAVKGAKVSCIIAASFARIFFRNAINVGLPIFISPEASAKIQPGDRLSVDGVAGIITNFTRNETYAVAPFPPFLQELIATGGLAPYVKKRLAAQEQAVSA